jgi:hypothetical protein
MFNVVPKPHAHVYRLLNTASRRNCRQNARRRLKKNKPTVCHVRQAKIPKVVIANLKVNDRSRGFRLLQWEMSYRFDSTRLREGCVDAMKKGQRWPHLDAAISGLSGKGWTCSETVPLASSFMLFHLYSGVEA